MLNAGTIFSYWPNSTLTLLQAGLTSGLPCLSLHCPVLARILLSQFNQIPPPQYLITVQLPHLPPSPRWWPITLSCLHQKSYVVASARTADPWCHLLVICHSLTPTRLLGCTLPLAHAVLGAEANLSPPLRGLLAPSPWPPSMKFALAPSTRAMNTFLCDTAVVQKAHDAIHTRVKAVSICVPIFAAIPLPENLSWGNNHGCGKRFCHRYAHPSGVYNRELSDTTQISNNTGLAT